MHANYPAYRDFIKWLDEKAKEIDDTWFRVDDETAVASQFRGQRLALEDVRSQLQAALKLDIAAESEKLQQLIERAKS
jgi:hypothetical protein